MQQQRPLLSPSSRAFTLAELVVIVLDLALGTLVSLLLAFVVHNPPKGDVPYFVWLLFSGALLGGFASLLAGICFLVRTRRLASLLQLLGVLGGALILIGAVLSPGQAFAGYVVVGFTLLAMAYVGKRLADAES